MTDVIAAMEGLVLADRYRLLSVLGSGGAGFVYEAEQLDLLRRVAIKILRPERLPLDRERFEIEARAASRINHPNAIAVYDYGLTREGIPFLVMERLRGRTLTELIEEAPIPIERAGSIASQMLAALQEAHGCGVTHRDLKSDNVVLESFRDGDDFVKVIDFGLARLADDILDDIGISGTPEYMAPEQIRGEDVGPAADIYAAGIVLYEMIVGRTPFAGASIPVILEGHLAAEPVSPHEIIPRCPPELGEVVLRALAKDPAERPQSAQEMREAIQAALQSADSSRRCASCGSSNPVSQRYCGECGEMLNGVAVVPAKEPRKALTLRSLPARAADSAEAVGRRSTRLRMPQHLERAFVGRHQELEHLLRFCQGGDVSATMALVGTPGIGKARLALEAAMRLSPTISTFFAAPDPSGLATAWYPILSMLEGILGLESCPSLEDLSAALARAGLPERDLPGLAELFAIPGPLEQAELAVRRREAYAVAIRTLRSVDRRFPGAVLCFADVDRYDRPSQNLIEALSESIDGDGPRLLITSSNREALPSGASMMVLPPLSMAESEELAKGMVGADVALPDAGFLFDQTMGSPARIERFAAWIAAGHSPDAAPSHDVDLVSTLVCRLPAAARRSLQAIAVNGTVAPIPVFDALVGANDSSTDHALTALADMGLVAREHDELTITSELVAEVVAACTPADARRELHSRVLATLDEIGLPASSGVLANHAERTGDSDRAYFEMLAAGDDAIRRFDDHGAASWYGRALAVSRAMLSSGEAEAMDRFIDASVRLADVMRFAGLLGLASGTLDEAELMQASSEQGAAIARARGRVAIARGDAAAGCEHLRNAIGLALRAGDREFVCETYVDLAGALRDLGDPGAAAAELTEGIDVLTLGEGLAGKLTAERLWLLGLRLAELRLQAGEVTLAESVAQRSLGHVHDSVAPQGRGRLYALLARIAETANDHKKALALRTRAIDELRALGDRRSTAELLIENARATADLRPIVADSSNGDFEHFTTDATRIARELATEIGWLEGAAMAASVESSWALR